MMDFTDEEIKKITGVLEKSSYYTNLDNYDTIIKRGEVNTEYNDITFRCSLGWIMLDLKTLTFKDGGPSKGAVTNTVVSVEEQSRKNTEYWETQIKAINMIETRN